MYSFTFHLCRYVYVVNISNIHLCHYRNFKCIRLCWYELLCFSTWRPALGRWLTAQVLLSLKMGALCRADTTDTREWRLFNSSSFWKQRQVFNEWEACIIIVGLTNLLEMVMTSIKETTGLGFWHIQHDPQQIQSLSISFHSITSELCRRICTLDI